MKRMMLTICLLSLLVAASGCQYWYQEGKPLKVCIQDYRECTWEAHKKLVTGELHAITAWGQEQLALEYCDQCMQILGYQQRPKKQLSVGLKTKHLYGSVYVAGE